MAEPDSTRSRGRSGSPTRQQKPAGSPLSWHTSGYWCKKVAGKLYYFGERHGDHQSAIRDWVKRKDDIFAGRDGGRLSESPDGVTVKLLCDTFLSDREHRVETGDLAKSSFDDYFATCKRLADHLGRQRLLTDLRADHFLELRGKLADGWAPSTLSNEIQRIRVVFNFAYQAELIDKPIRLGPTFKRPSKKTLRLHRQAQEPKLLSASEIRSVIDIASDELKAMILLGINAALGNRDVAKLAFKHVDGQWLDFPRPKTGIKRRAKLWPETVDALSVAIEKRKEPKDEEHAEIVFVTKYRGPWFSESNKDCPLAKEMRKLLDKIGVKRRGVGFYALRHTFKTVADETKDFAAVEHVMGHESDAVASMYREGISDDRLSAVAEHVRGWLFTEGAAK